MTKAEAEKRIEKLEERISALNEKIGQASNSARRHSSKARDLEAGAVSHWSGSAHGRSLRNYDYARSAEQRLSARSFSSQASAIARDRDELIGKLNAAKRRIGASAERTYYLVTHISSPTPGKESSELTLISIAAGQFGVKRSRPEMEQLISSLDTDNELTFMEPDPFDEGCEEDLHLCTTGRKISSHTLTFLERMGYNLQDVIPGTRLSAEKAKSKTLPNGFEQKAVGIKRGRAEVSYTIDSNRTIGPDSHDIKIRGKTADGKGFFYESVHGGSTVSAWETSSYEIDFGQKAEEDLNKRIKQVKKIVEEVVMVKLPKGYNYLESQSL